MGGGGTHEKCQQELKIKHKKITNLDIKKYQFSLSVVVGKGAKTNLKDLIRMSLSRPL